MPKKRGSKSQRPLQTDSTTAQATRNDKTVGGSDPSIAGDNRSDVKRLVRKRFSVAVHKLRCLFENVEFEAMTDQHAWLVYGFSILRCWLTPFVGWSFRICGRGGFLFVFTAYSSPLFTLLHSRSIGPWYVGGIGFL